MFFQIKTRLWTRHRLKFHFKVGGGPGLLRGGQTDSTLWQWDTTSGHHGHDHLWLPHGWVDVTQTITGFCVTCSELIQIQPNRCYHPRFQCPAVTCALVQRSRMEIKKHYCCMHSCIVNYQSHVFALFISLCLHFPSLLNYFLVLRHRKHGSPPLWDVWKVWKRDFYHPPGQRQRVSCCITVCHCSQLS